jgi:hypothetical protein
MTITATSDVRVRTISDTGVAAVLSGTHLDGYGPTVVQYATQYQVDPNYFLAYTKWENLFLSVLPNYPPQAVAMNNPFDILCVNAPCNDGNCPHVYNPSCGDPSGNQFATGCVNPGNGWCYTAYPDLTTGIQAAFWQANVYYTRDGIAPTWGAMLAAAGFAAVTIPNILADANTWANSYPYQGSTANPCGTGLVWDPVSQTCLPAQILPVNLAAALAGVGLLAVGGYVIWRSL